MKKILAAVSIAVFAATTTVEAQTIWSEDFSVNTHMTSWAFGAQIGDGDIWSGVLDQWYSGGPGVNGSGQFVVRDHQDANKPRAAVIALDGTSIGAGNYNLKFDYSLWAGADMDVQVWDVQTGATTDDYYTLKYADGGVQINQVLTAGTASKDQLAYLGHTNPAGSGSDAGTYIVNFDYDGTGDIGLMFGISSIAGFYQAEMQIDNLSIAVPEPSSFALAGLGLAGLTILRRRRF